MDYPSKYWESNIGYACFLLATDSVIVIVTVTHEIIWEPSKKSATTKDIREFVFHKPYSLSKKGQVLL